MTTPTSSAPEPVGGDASVTRFDPCVEIERTDSGGELRYPDMQPATLGDYVCYDDYCALATAHAAQAAELREAEQRAARCEQDAARYRWLLSNVEEIRHSDWVWWREDDHCKHVNDRVDAALASPEKHDGQD